MLKLQPSVAPDVSVFGDKVFKGVIKLVEPLGWALIRYDWFP